MKRLLGVAAGMALAAAAAAQSDYPTRPISMVVGFAPGGGTDTLARILARTVGDDLGQQVVVENKPGASGTIATNYVAKSAPDGYTILLGTVGSLSVAPHIMKGLPYDPLHDLAPITLAVAFPNVIVVQPSLPVKSLADFVSLAREKPGTLTYASSGVGGAGHLAGELLKSMARIDIVHVPFKGGGPAMQAFLGQQVDSFFATPVSSVKQVQAGRARALATTGKKRTALMPDVPTVAESGYPQYEALNWYAYVAPAKTPHRIIERLNRELVKALHDPQVTPLLASQGLEPRTSSPEELARYIKSEYDTWGRVVKEAGIKAQ